MIGKQIKQLRTQNQVKQDELKQIMDCVGMNSMTTTLK